jgi:hypothetical protein
MEIPVEKNFVAIQSFLQGVGQTANETGAGFFKQQQTIFVADALACFYLSGNLQKIASYSCGIDHKKGDEKQRYEAGRYLFCRCITLKNPYLPLLLIFYSNKTA